MFGTKILSDFRIKFVCSDYYIEKKTADGLNESTNSLSQLVPFTEKPRFILGQSVMQFFISDTHLSRRVKSNSVYIFSNRANFFKLIMAFINQHQKREYRDKSWFCSFNGVCLCAPPRHGLCPSSSGFLRSLMEERLEHSLLHERHVNVRWSEEIHCRPFLAPNIYVGVNRSFQSLQKWASVEREGRTLTSSKGRMSSWSKRTSSWDLCVSDYVMNRRLLDPHFQMAVGKDWANGQNEPGSVTKRGAGILRNGQLRHVKPCKAHLLLTTQQKHQERPPERQRRPRWQHGCDSNHHWSPWKPAMCERLVSLRPHRSLPVHMEYIMLRESLNLIEERIFYQSKLKRWRTTPKTLEYFLIWTHRSILARCIWSTWTYIFQMARQVGKLLHNILLCNLKCSTLPSCHSCRSNLHNDN